MKIIHVPHHSGNFTPEIEKVLAELPENEPAEIRFAPDVYHFSKTGASRTRRVINAIDQGEKSVAFLLENRKDLVIDGGGAELVFDDRMFPFALFDCRNVTIRNFVIDFSFSRYCQGDVTASDETGFELRIDPSLFQVEVDSAGHVAFLGGGGRFSTESGSKTILIGNAVFGKPPWDYLFAGNNTDDRSHLATTFLDTDAVCTENGVRFTYRPTTQRRLIFPVGDTLIFNYEPRANAEIMAQGCREIRVEHVSIYRGGGMGIVVTDTEDFAADDVRIMVRPGRDECRSTTADGFYFTQCRGRVSVTNSLISQTLDDALNIHGLYTEVAAILAADTLELVMPGNDRHWGFSPCRIGDMLTLSDCETHRIRFAAKVLACTEPDPGRWIVRLDRPVAGTKIGDPVENETAAADFEFAFNRVERCPHLRISDNGKLRVHDNVLTEINGILVQDLFKYWYEAGAVQDLAIENNTFRDSPQFGKNQVILIRSQRKPGSGVMHRNVTIRNNVFEHCGNGAPVMVLRDIAGLTLLHNLSHGAEPYDVADCREVEKQFFPSAS